MEYRIMSHRHAGVILNEPEFIDQFTEVTTVISQISEIDIIKRHESYGALDSEKTPKSLSKCLNELIKEGFENLSWASEPGIFQDSSFQGDTWRLDFAKQDISIEVAFNHQSVIAWNLLKPVIASELNHVEKAIQTKLGIIVTATQALKEAGGFDGAIGTYEKYIDYLKPLNNIISTPVLVIGLEAPKSFVIEQIQYKPRKKIGLIRPKLS